MSHKIPLQWLHCTEDGSILESIDIRCSCCFSRLNALALLVLLLLLTLLTLLLSLVLLLLINVAVSFLLSELFLLELPSNSFQ